MKKFNKLITQSVRGDRDSDATCSPVSAWRQMGSLIAKELVRSLIKQHGWNGCIVPTFCANLSWSLTGNVPPI